MKLVAFLFLTIPTLAIAHGGSVDNNGGHNDHKNGGYHCHRASCAEQFKRSDAAVEEATNAERNFSYIYRREDWKHWSDVDNDCMNTRHEVLKDQADGQIKLSPDGCYVSMGVWNDPFSGKTFTRASDLDVDHIIPLKWANDHGGGEWPKAKKEEFANDPINLLAVDDGLNKSKGAKGPNEWMPPNYAFRCEYLRLWLDVLTKYSELQMASSEKRVFDRQLGACKY
ncbi:HNH endonuclease [Teredinibacter purpureus]|uniref:HNH endonuclease n=1 Tax=Teredinibacter purpureus TaxID=2731756 RepID=UPI0005F84AD2|nr:HNH endonuclease [Teredinibacter purpureus]